MGRTYETENSAQASAIAQALIEAAGEDQTSQITTTTGQNGRVAFEVPDDFPQVSTPDTDDDGTGGALHHGVDRVIADTTPDGLEPEPKPRQAKRRPKHSEPEQQPAPAGEQS